MSSSISSAARGSSAPSGTTATKPPDGDGHLYEAETAYEAELEHERRRRSGRFPWLGFPISITLAEAPPDGPRW